LTPLPEVVHDRLASSFESECSLESDHDVKELLCVPHYSISPALGHYPRHQVALNHVTGFFALLSIIALLDSSETRLDAGRHFSFHSQQTLLHDHLCLVFEEDFRETDLPLERILLEGFSLLISVRHEVFGPFKNLLDDRVYVKSGWLTAEQRTKLCHKIFMVLSVAVADLADPDSLKHAS